MLCPLHTLPRTDPISLLRCKPQTCTDVPTIDDKKDFEVRSQLRYRFGPFTYAFRSSNATPHAPCDPPCSVSMTVGCCLVLELRCFPLQELNTAFADLGFDKAHVHGIFEVLSAVLMLGNLEFKETKPDEAAVTKDTRKQLGIAANLFHLDQAQLAHKLVTRDIKVQQL